MFTRLGTNTFVHVMHAHDSGCMHDVVCAYVRSYVCACIACPCHVYPESFWFSFKLRSYRWSSKRWKRWQVPLRVCSSIACALRWLERWWGIAVWEKAIQIFAHYDLLYILRLTLTATTRRIIGDYIRSWLQTLRRIRLSVYCLGTTLDQHAIW